MGVSIIEEEKPACCLSPKIYQPPKDMDVLNIEIPRRKKMYASSSFYEEPNAVYPTIQEQVELCRQIAASLSDDCNVKSKGANMFFKRVKRAEKWVVAESKDEESTEDKDPASMPYVRPKGEPPKLKLILAPRQVIDLNYLLKEGVEIIQHDAMSPEICHTIVKDLNSPTGKGAELFAKRKKKSEEWIVDDEKVKHLMETRYKGGYSSPEPTVPTISPEIDFNALAETVISAAESKVMTYPNAVPHVPVIQSVEDTSSSSSSQQQSEAYKFRAPKGWTGSAAASPLPAIAEDSTLSEKISSTATPASHNLPRYSPICRSKSFCNFNSTPRAWNSDIYEKFRPAVIKPVKPPSVLVQ